MAEKLIMAKSIEEATASKNTSAAFLAGGTEVNRLGSTVSAQTLISLKKCEGLRDIKAEAGYVIIGAMCTFQDIVESDKVPAYIKEAALFMASRTKRNMATIGGNIAAKRSDSYLLPTLIAAGAVIELAGKENTEKIGTEEYIGNADSYSDYLITSVTVPAAAKVLSKRYANTAQSHAMLTMSAALTEDGFVLAGALKNSGITRFTGFEEAVNKDPAMSEDDIIEKFKGFGKLHVKDDMFGSAEYKRYIMGVTAADLCRRLKSEA